MIAKYQLLVLIVFVWVVFFSISWFLFFRSRKNVLRVSYSILGADTLYGNMFNTLLVANGGFHISFFLSLFPIIQKHMGLFGIIGIVFLFLTTVAGVGTGIITLKTNGKIHRILAWIGFSCAGIGWTGLSTELFARRPEYGIGMMMLGLLFTPLMIPIYRKYNDLPAVYETVFFFAACATDMLIVILCF